MLSMTQTAETAQYASALADMALKVKLLDLTVGLKLSVDEQREGLDLVIHGERAYDLAE